jgi:predicted Na+-dependent transporter
VRRWAERISDAVLPLTLAAALLGLLAPAASAARRADLLLAGLVFFTALGIDLWQLMALRARWRTVFVLSLVPFVVLGPLAWALSRLFDEPTRSGVLALGLAPTEVAAVGLVALAGGEAALALGVLATSLVASAILGPLVMSGIGGGGDVAAGALLGRFALVVIVPLVIGVTARTVVSRLEDAEPQLAALSTIAVVALVYASLSASSDIAQLAQAAAASAAFVVACAAGGAVLLRRSRSGAAGALSVAMRDFAVVAALATQAAGPRAGTVAGAYGVLVLVLGAAAASRLRRTPLAEGRGLGR